MQDGITECIPTRRRTSMAEHWLTLKAAQAEEVSKANVHLTWNALMNGRLANAEREAGDIQGDKP